MAVIRTATKTSPVSARVYNFFNINAVKKSESVQKLPYELKSYSSFKNSLL